MGIGGISVWQLLIILAIVIVIFGSKRIRNLGEDLGGFLSGLKKGARELAGTKEELDEVTNQIKDNVRDINDSLRDSR